MISVYDIEYKYLDDLDTEWHNTSVAVYNSDDAEGEEFQKILDVASETDDFRAVNEWLPEDYTDDYIMFYLDLAGYKPMDIVPELQKELDILINEITFITED